MSRKAFIESHGATCRNWNWSWSFINKRKKVVIFGAWVTNTRANTTLIMDAGWEFNHAGKKNPGYSQAREHLSLVESGAFTLQTFPMISSNDRKDKEGIGPARIKSIVEVLTPKTLIRKGKKWYASDDGLVPPLSEEVINPTEYIEGASRRVSVNAYERNAKARAVCIEHFGARCSVCGFDFGAAYGKRGSGFTHVHHLVPLYEIGKRYTLDPIRDLRPVCPNCHAMIHRDQPALTIRQLKRYLDRARQA